MRERNSWRGMKDRCKRIPRYIPLGYTSRWEKFDDFYADMGPRPEGTTLERIDNEKGYSPENCKWGTFSEQNRNRRAIGDVPYTGVTKHQGKYRSRIYYNGKNKNLGSYDTPELASEVYELAKEVYCG